MHQLAMTVEPAQHNAQRELETRHEKPDKPVHKFPWESLGLPEYFISGLRSKAIVEPELFSSSILFRIFLSMTVTQHREDPLDDSDLNILIAAALKDSSQAQAAILAVLDHHEADVPDLIRGHMDGWLRNAVATGCVHARQRLRTSDTASCTTALEAFCSNGGYGIFYHLKDELPALHRLVSYGTLHEIQKFMLTAKGWDLEGLTDDRETSLYLACARGAWDIAEMLLDRGASASAFCTNFGVPCLHWVFTFDESVQALAVVRLIAAGADVNAQARQPVPFPHFPFLLPAGSALHWAVVTSSSDMMRALIENGADYTIRDGSDPYIYDGRVRMLDRFGGVNQEARSSLRSRTHGRSPLDYAAMQCDPLIFTILGALKLCNGINAVDEEGFSVLHRLSESHIRRNRMQLCYSFVPFRGSKHHVSDQLRKTVKAICDLGGDLELLTRPLSCTTDGGTPAFGFESRTPLMLAVNGAVPSVVQALLHAGADPNTVNERGNTALSYLSNGDMESLRHLVSAGGNIHHKNQYGNTALCVATNQGEMSSVELLLSLGSDIEERILTPNTIHHYQCSVFAVLPTTGLPFDETYDAKLASVLEKYVFSQTEPEKIRRVVEHDPNGETLLHRCASNSMRLSVKTLLRYGANVNAIATKHKYRKRGNEQVRLSWGETPLDEAMNFKEYLQKVMERDRRYTIPEYEDLCQRINAIIDSITENGGKRASRDEKVSRIDPNPKPLDGS